MMQATAIHPEKEVLLPVGLLVCDFDDTLSAQDTISIIFEAAIESQRQQNGLDASLRVERLAASLGEGYTQKYNAFMCNNLPKLGTSVTYNQLGVQIFLAELSAFDREMVTVVEESCVLKGIPAGTLEAAGRAKVRLKPRSREVLLNSLEAGVAIHICSVNWSEALVRGALEGVNIATGQAAGVVVHCNNLVVEGGWSTGQIVRRIVCADDKQQVTGHLLRQNCVGCSVVCGDSLSDLHALLAADFGIVIGSNGSLRRVLKAAGISLHPLSLVKRDAVGPRGALLHAGDWGEIDAFLYPK